MKNFDIDKIVRIETMPKVFSQLEEIGKYIDEQVKDIDILPCTEENKQEVKKRRTEVNNTLKILEDRRKEIKNKLLEPYEIFNEKYENECKGKLQGASEILKTKIDTIEEEQKKEKELELREFAQQHIEVNNLQDIITFEDIGLNITLSASMSSLKDQIVDFVKKVSDDLECISSDEDRDEILYEYQHNGFNYQQAILIIRKKKEELNKIKEQMEQQEQAQKEVEKIIERVEQALEVPKEIIEPDEIIEVQFKVKGTKEQIKQIKNLILQLGVEYE
jgi:hypothetical protein